MTTENLREFITLAEIGNYAAAAEPLFISEATLSRHIMALEAELGAPLFERFPRSIKLTELGAVFMPFAQQITAAEDACIRAIDRQKAQSKSTLSIGFDEALAYYGVAELLAGFKKVHPEILLQIKEANTFSLREQVADGQLQLAFVLHDEMSRSENLDYKAFRRDVFAVALPVNHPLAAQESIHLSKLNSESLLLPPPLTAMYELCMKAFRRFGFEPNSLTTAFLSGRGARELVRNGVCLAVMPKQFALAWADEAIAVRDIVPRMLLETALLSTPSSLGKTGQLFLNYLTEVEKQ